MKSVCIICESSNLIEANALSKTITGSEIFKTPLSEKGKAPATHWFTYLKTNDEGINTLLGLQPVCTVEEIGVKEFLSKYKLNIIKEE